MNNILKVKSLILTINMELYFAPFSDLLTKLKKDNDLKIGVSLMDDQQYKIDYINKFDLTPDSIVSTNNLLQKDDLSSPFMIYRNMELQNVYSPSTVVTIGTTSQAIEQGLNANCWTVGVGNGSPDLINEGLPMHYMVNTLIDLPIVLQSINWYLEDELYPDYHKYTKIFNDGLIIKKDQYLDMCMNKNTFLL